MTRSSAIDVELGGVRFGGEVLTIRARGKGQDVVRTAVGFVGVADGATPLDGEPAATVRDFAAAALRALNRQCDQPARTAFAAAIASTAELASRGPGQPSCAIAIARTLGDRIEVAALGDCLAVVAPRHGEPAVLRDTQLRRLDGRVTERMRRSIAAGESPEAARERILPDLRANRASMDRPGGYWIYAADPTAARHVRTRSVTSATTAAILLCSDGFHRLWEPFGIVEGPADLLRLAGSEGLATLGRRLRSIEARANSLERYPRFSRYDDATAILLTRR